MNTNHKTLIENLKETGKGVLPIVNPIKDLAHKGEFDLNSWFAIGHFITEGEKLNFLYHLMIMKAPDDSLMLNSCISITNETTGWYRGEDVFIPLSDGDVSETGFQIKAPNGIMAGDLDELRVQAIMAGGEINVTMKGAGYPLYNGGAGIFSMLGMLIHQYSLPTMETSGTITIEGKEYKVDGISWFDRQWQNHAEKRQDPNKIFAGKKWSWMDVNLDNGEAISLWDAFDMNTGNETAWATILHPDGTQTVTTVEPFSSGESEYWMSPESGQNYPTHWVLKIPAFDACLEIIPAPKEQEIVSEVPFLHKYEGASTVRGTYKGQEVSGYCYVELLGEWR